MGSLRITLISCALLLVTSEAGIFSAACESGWFGSDCQYRCRCDGNKCDGNGICKDGSTCSTGWFGPACQYVDLATGSQIERSGSSYEYNELTDGNDITCIDVSSFKSLTVNLKTSYPFTWMRIYVSRPDAKSGFQIQLKNAADGRIKSNCSNQNTFVISEKAIDIYCDLDVAVDQVTVLWKNVQSMCSVYISGGRNVALRQKTSQSSNYSTSGNDVSSVAVNDELKWVCAHTKNESSPHWNLFFSQPKVVNRYVLYNRHPFVDDIPYCCDVRLQGFILESFSKNGSQIFSHTDTRGIQYEYPVLSVGVKEPVSSVKITATFREFREDHSSAFYTFLALCEVQVYGDSQCPKGQYGLECNKRCNCAKDEDCFVSTGGCPSGCAAGFYREGCLEKCPTGYNGIDCIETCNDNCRNQSCDSVSGKCNGCVTGKQGDFCTNECPTGYHGIDCFETCNDNCRNQSCDSVSGKCNGCVPGKEGDFCTNEKSSDGSLELKIGIGVACTIVLLVILAVVLGIVLFRSKKICKSKTGEDERSQNYEDVISSETVEHPYEDIYLDADGYCIPHDHHSSDLKETVAYENIATYQNDSTKE